MAAATGAFGGFSGDEEVVHELEVQSTPDAEASRGTPRLPVSSSERLQFTDNLGTAGVVFDIPF